MNINLKMKRLLRCLVLAAVSGSGTCAVVAQVLPPEHALVPVVATSADSLKQSMSDPTCLRPNKGDPYPVTMVANNITVQLGERITTA